ncbi:helix-turn-helix transcriptional regulator [Rhizobium sp. CSW-27]|uniref:helix-turn-helix domain-containing protein n=1 Tax=Rhizobium sp. CSW-27 TaxID=2839985 RepID=UPI001C0283D1|nr:helix-turn-helix transcriptional regulator [Rhizobium sp. CSW-27]MBT9373161.1 helix-turn-helix domain-containing protein [Rhizobium sp. CSW-27]
MKLHFTPEWLRFRIENDPDIDTEAGFPLRDARPLNRFIDAASNLAPATDPARLPERARPVLHVLMLQVRRRDKMSITQLADKIKVESEELQSIESDPRYVPRPRTLHRIAEYLNVPAVAVQSLTADAVVRSEKVAEESLRFAASSDDLSALSKTERQRLNDFVKFLSTLDKGN